MENKQEELNILIGFIREQYEASGIDLDYSFESLKHMDALMESEYKNGKIIDPEGSFAEREGMILTGIAGYLAKVVLLNSEGCEIIIDDNDEDWYLNFAVKSTNGWEFWPGQRVLKRKIEGEASNLYHYAVTAVKYITDNISSAHQLTSTQLHHHKKKWWKFW